MKAPWRIEDWMRDVAEKHEVDVETVACFYFNIVNKREGMTRRQQTEEFFDLYFEELRDEYKGNYNFADINDSNDCASSDGHEVREGARE